MTRTKPLPLPQAAAELRRRGHPTTYSALYKGVLNGVVPAHQVNGRWYVAQDDLARIADTLPQAA